MSFADAPLKLPHDYQYDDAEPLAVVSPKVLWDDVPATAAAAAGREQFAAWVVTHDNRQFARTIANRMWRKLMGVGLVEPVDDFRDENPASFPALLEHLTDEMLRLDFDLREFVRIIVSTDAYQRRAVAYDPTSAAPFRFTAPALRRMTAEQLWDSILMLVARNPWSVQRPTPEQIASAVSLDLSKARVEDVQRQCDEFMDAYGRGYVRRMQQICGYRGQLLVRASEIPTPLPLGHFLRQFGQSDREAIEAARQVATIPQILAMFNGPITHSMLERGSVIYDNVIAHRPEEAIDVVFLSVLSHRSPVRDSGAHDRRGPGDGLRQRDLGAAQYPRIHLHSIRAFARRLFVHGPSIARLRRRPRGSTLPPGARRPWRADGARRHRAGSPGRQPRRGGRLPADVEERRQHHLPDDAGCDDPHRHLRSEAGPRGAG